MYDTLRGIRGEVQVQIRLQFFGDVNPFKDSSAGVQIYGTSAMIAAAGYRIAEVVGFVDVLLNEGIICVEVHCIEILVYLDIDDCLDTKTTRNTIGVILFEPHAIVTNPGKK